jgi:ribonuclease HI
MVFYAVARGREVGVFATWAECQQSVKGFKGALFCKTETREEAEAFVGQGTKTLDRTLDKDTVYVYTDGSCLHNGYKNASAGIGIFFGPGDPRNVSTTIKGKQTNNTAELTALVVAYSILEKEIQEGMQVTLVSDSEYAIRCVTSYGRKCETTGWPEIPNRELVQRAYGLYRDKPNVHFLHVKAHTGKQDIHSIGNAHADLLAGQASIKA